MRNLKTQNNRKPKNLLGSLLLSLLLLEGIFPGRIGSQANDLVRVNRDLIPIVTIVDKPLIEMILEQCLIPESNVEKMDVLDINQNGFGERDIARVYPSSNVYLLEKISSDVQNKMDSWGFRANFQITGENRLPAAYDSVETEKAAHSIFSTLLRGINRNYHDYPIKIRFERDSIGVIFEMWEYHEDKLEIGNPQPFMPDSVITYDIFHVFHDDTLINFDTTLYDIIHIRYDQVDTVFIGQHAEPVQHREKKIK
jgi:hypothetical protein